MQATPAQIEQYLAHYTADDDVEVLPENMPIVNWFIQIYNDGLFKYVGAACTGLDVLAVQADAHMSGTKVNSEHYIGIKIMAQVYSEEFNKKQAKNAE